MRFHNYTNIGLVMKAKLPGLDHLDIMYLERFVLEAPSLSIYTFALAKSDSHLFSLIRLNHYHKSSCKEFNRLDTLGPAV